MKIRREMVTYLVASIILVASFLFIYFSETHMTGFVVFEQENQSDFDEGTYNNTEYDGDAIVLSSGQSSGTYTSKVFDALGPAQWNNISWIGTFNGELPNNKAIETGANGANMTGNVLLYHLNEESGSLIDSSGESYDGTNNGADYNSEGIFNSSLYFDGTDTVDCGDAGNFERTNSFSVEVWIKAPSPNEDGIVQRYNGVSGWALFLTGTGSLVLDIKHNSSNYIRRRSIDSVMDNSWRHIIFTYDGSSTLAGTDIYIDGILNNRETGTSDTLTDTISTITNCKLGILHNYGNYRFNGNIDEVAFYERELSPDEVLDHYKRGILKLNLTARSCNDSNCDGEDFININDTSPQDLNVDDNRYFQYKFNFETDDSSYSPELHSVEIDYSSLGPSISITNPIEDEQFNYSTNLPLNFIISNSSALDSCWYNLNGEENITIPNCQNITFNASDGYYQLYLYVNDSVRNLAQDNVNFSVSVVGVFLTLSEPTGTKSSRTDIPIQFSVIGNNLTCWYNIKTSVGGNVIENTTLSNCSNSVFDVSADGNYVFNLYANNTLEAFDSKNSSFTVDTSPSLPSGNGGGSSGGGGTYIPLESYKIECENISSLTINKGGIKKILSWNVKNNGTSFLNECTFRSLGKFSSWIDYTETKGLAEGEVYTFVFDVNIPEEIEPGNYALEVLLDCQETNVSVSFNVNVIEKRLDFVLIDVVRKGEESVKVTYSIKDIFGEDQEIEVQFLLFDLDGKQVAEVNEYKTILANSKQEFETFIPINKFLEGELSLLANLNSETFSTFVQESVILGSPISGFTVFDRLGGRDNIVSVALVILFLGFTFFIIRKIRKHKNKLKKK
jgi:hypothetical protein